MLFIIKEEPLMNKFIQKISCTNLKIKFKPDPEDTEEDDWDTF